MGRSRVYRRPSDLNGPLWNIPYRRQRISSAVAECHLSADRLHRNGMRSAIKVSLDPDFPRSLPPDSLNPCR